MLLPTSITIFLAVIGGGVYIYIHSPLNTFLHNQCITIDIPMFEGDIFSDSAF